MLQKVFVFATYKTYKKSRNPFSLGVVDFWEMGRALCLR